MKYRRGEKLPKALVADVDLCTGCELCAQICAWKKFKSMNPRRGAVHVIRDEPTVLDAPVFCIQCGLCIAACPPKALKRVTVGGWVEVDEEKCDACGWCAVVCPLGVIHVDSITKKAVKCDYCKGEPACVEWCPQHVLKYVDVKEADFYKQRDFARLASRHGAHTWWGRHKLWIKPWYK